MAKFIVILDGHGQYHAGDLRPYAIAVNAAKALAERLGLDDTPGEVFHFITVEASDAGAARLLARGKTVEGSFKTEKK